MIWRLLRVLATFVAGAFVGYVLLFFYPEARQQTFVFLINWGGWVSVGLMVAGTMFSRGPVVHMRQAGLATFDAGVGIFATAVLFHIIR